MNKIKVNLPDVVGKGYKEFWNYKGRYRVLKGGRASKKSRTMALWSITNIMKYPLSNMVVVRRYYNTHKDSTFAVLKWAIERLQVSHLWVATESPLQLVYKPTGQKIIFRGFDDVFKITSITVSVGVLCWAWIEEAFEINDYNDFKTLDESIRGEMPNGLFKQLTLTFNPWTSSHWTKDMFFDNKHSNALAMTTTYKCNEWLDQSDIDLIEELEFSDIERFKVVGLGEYGTIGGNYFDEFRRSIHVVDSFKLTSDHKVYVSLDYGLDMFAVLFIAVDYYGKETVYKQIHKSDLIISEAANEFKRVKGNDNVSMIYAPGDLWNRRQETGRSVYDIFRENGVILTKSNNDRETGSLNTKERLKVNEIRDIDTGLPVLVSNMQIVSNCIDLIRCLVDIKKDEVNPNQYANEPHELTHIVDALRYYCLGRQANVKQVDKRTDVQRFNNERVDTTDSFVDSSINNWG